MRSLLRMQHRVLGGTRRLVRAAAAAELRAPIWLVTRGLGGHRRRHRVAGPELPVGFRRAAALELPLVWGGLADLGADGDGADWSRLVDHAVTASRDSAVRKTRWRCVTARSTFPGWSGCRAHRQPTRWNYAATQRIW